MNRRQERVLASTPESDQGAEPEILAAHQRLGPDGIHTYVFGDEKHSYGEPEGLPAELDDSRSYILGDEVASGLRVYASIIKIDALGVATMPKSLLQAVMDKDPDHCGVAYPIMNDEAEVVALVGLARTSFDLIVEPLGFDLEPEISVYFAHFCDFIDGRGFVEEAEKKSVVTKCEVDERGVGTVIVEEPHVFPQGVIYSLGLDFPFLFVRIDP